MFAVLSIKTKKEKKKEAPEEAPFH